MYILITKNSFDGTKRYEYETFDEALGAYEQTRSLLMKIFFGVTYELSLYKDSENQNNLIKRCIITK